MNEWYPQRGGRKFERMEGVVEKPHAWTAETPYLYTLKLALLDKQGSVVEQVQQRIGFRWVSGRKRTVDGERKTYQTAWREPA